MSFLSIIPVTIASFNTFIFHIASLKINNYNLIVCLLCWPFLKYEKGWKDAIDKGRLNERERDREREGGRDYTVAHFSVKVILPRFY